MQVVLALCLTVVAVAQTPSLCSDMATQHIKDLKIDNQGQLFFIDIANKIYAVKPNCGERKLIYSDATILPNNIRIRIPTSLTIGLDELGRPGIYVANFVPPAPLLYFLEFDFDTLTILNARALPIDATFISEISTAPDGDIFAVDQQQAILRYNVLTKETTTFLGFSSGIVDVFDITTSQDCPVLYISANDNDEVWRCKDLFSGDTCVPFTSSGLQSPWGLALDCQCQLYVGSHANGNLRVFSPPNTVRSELLCPYEAELVQPGAYINSDGALVSDATGDGRALFRFPRAASFWAKTRCGTNSSWLVNGQTFHVPSSADFVWHEFGTPSGITNFFPLVQLEVDSAGCEIAQVFMGIEGDRLPLGLLDRECASAYLCASEFCTTGHASIIDVPNQGPALNSACSHSNSSCTGTSAVLVFDSAIFASGSKKLYLETSCETVDSNSWFVNGQLVNFPLTSDFTWHEVGLISSATVILTPGEADCRIRGAFLGFVSGQSAIPVLPYVCSCCVKETTVYYTMFGDIFATTVDGTKQKCSGNTERTIFREVQVNDVAVRHTCTFQPTLPPSATPSGSVTPTGTPTPTNSPTPTRTQTSTATSTATQSSTGTSSRTQTSTATSTQTQTATATPTRTSSLTATSSPSQTPSRSATPSVSSSATPTTSLPVSFVLSTIFANGRDTGAASQGNQQTNFRTFQSGRGLVMTIVLLQTIGTGSPTFVRFVGTDALGLTTPFPIISRYRLFSAVATLRLATCPTQTPISSLDNFLKARILQFLTAFAGSPTSLDASTQKALFLDDITGIECIPPQLTSPVCDPTANNIPTLCPIPNTVFFTWGVVWDATDEPCVSQNGVSVCLQPFTANNPVFTGFSTYTSHVTDTQTSLKAALPLNAQIQVVRGVFGECSSSKTVAAGQCTSSLTSAEVGTGKAQKSANFCFRPPNGFQNTCASTSPSDFGCFCDECCYVFGDCCPDVQFCTNAGALGGECHSGAAIVSTLPSCIALCGA